LEFQVLLICDTIPWIFSEAGTARSPQATISPAPPVAGDAGRVAGRGNVRERAGRLSADAGWASVALPDEELGTASQSSAATTSGTLIDKAGNVAMANVAAITSITLSLVGAIGSERGAVGQQPLLAS
jgi:hypothetical protein